MDHPTLLTTAQVSEAGGLHYRVVDYWTRIGAIPCAHPADGSGSRRLYDESAVAVVRRLVAAREFLGRRYDETTGGIPAAMLAKVADLLDERDRLRGTIVILEAELAGRS